MSGLPGDVRDDIDQDVGEAGPVPEGQPLLQQQRRTALQEGHEGAQHLLPEMGLPGQQRISVELGEPQRSFLQDPRGPKSEVRGSQS